MPRHGSRCSGTHTPSVLAPIACCHHSARGGRRSGTDGRRARQGPPAPRRPWRAMCKPPSCFIHCRREVNMAPAAARPPAARPSGLQHHHQRLAAAPAAVPLCPRQAVSLTGSGCHRASRWRRARGAPPLLAGCQGQHQAASAGRGAGNPSPRRLRRWRAAAAAAAEAAITGSWLLALQLSSPAGAPRPAACSKRT